MNHRIRNGESSKTPWLLIGGALLASLVLITSAIAVAPGILNGHSPQWINDLPEGRDAFLLEESLGSSGRHAQPELPDPEADLRPVRVRSDQALLSLAESHGAVADGTAEDPLVIHGSKLIETNPTSIMIENTDLHIVVEGLEFAGQILLDQANNVTFRGLAIMDHHTAFVATNITNLVLEGSEFHANKRAIVLYGAQNVHIRDSRFTENGHALLARDPDPQDDHLREPSTKRIAFSNNLVTRTLQPGGLPEQAGILGTGVLLAGVELNVSGNRFEGHYPSALRAQGTHIQVTGNEFVSENERGVLIVDSEDVLLMDNRFQRNLKSGVVSHGNSNVQLVGNEFDKNPHGGIRVVGGHGIEVTQNRFHWSHVAIHMHSTRDSLIHGNNVQGGTQGVNLVDTQRIVVKENEFNGIWEDAVRVAWGSQVEIKQNTVYQGKKHGFFTWGAEDILIARNTLHNTKVGTVVMGGSSQVAVESNRIDGKAQVGVWILDSQRTALKDNEIHEQDFGLMISSDPQQATVQGGFLSANYAGVLIKANDETVTIKDVTIAGNNKGVLVEDASNPLLKSLTIKENNVGIQAARSQSVTLTGNHIADNRVGLYFASTTDSLAYNNVFDNPTDRNVHLVNSPDNQWHIPRRPGPNIIGGPWIAGNHWHDYQGVDVNGDGIGNVPHEPIVYHPLLELPAYEFGLPMGPFDLQPLVR